MTFRISAVASGLVLCWLAAAAVADQVEATLRLDPLDVALVATLPGIAGALPVLDPRLPTVGPLAPPDIADVIGIVLPNPIASYSPGSLWPTLADVIDGVTLANCAPYNPPDPDTGWGWGWGAQSGTIAETSKAWRAKMAAHQAQNAQNHAQRITAFSAAIQAQFDIAMDPDRSPFDTLLAGALVKDGGLLTTEFPWSPGVPDHVESVFLEIRASQPGFFGE